MSRGEAHIPVVLFAYARPAHLARVLACMRENRVPLIYAFADGAKGVDDAERVAQTRALLRGINWCEMRLIERPENFGLGQSVITGVSEVAERHDAFIVWEDDLICVPGTYRWLCAALNRYTSDPRVMSVTAWTHPRVVPADVGDSPYFDGRAECGVWGAYARSWRGMDQPALEKLAVCVVRGISPDSYGADLEPMARIEKARNIWAVRWLYHHLQNSGLCLRLSSSAVEHIGFDATATNAPEAVGWANPSLRAAPIPLQWPEVREHPDCARLWRAANMAPRVSLLRKVWLKLTGR